MIYSSYSHNRTGEEGGSRPDIRFKKRKNDDPSKIVTFKISRHFIICFGQLKRTILEGVKAYALYARENDDYYGLPLR